MKSLSCSHWKCRHWSKMEGPNTFPVATLKLLTASWRGDFFHLLREAEKLGAHHWMKARCLCQSKNQSPNSLVHQLHHSHPVAVRKDNGSSVCMLWSDLRGFWDIYVVQEHWSVLQVRCPQSAHQPLSCNCGRLGLQGHFRLDHFRNIKGASCPHPFCRHFEWSSFPHPLGNVISFSMKCVTHIPEIRHSVW